MADPLVSIPLSLDAASASIICTALGGALAFVYRELRAYVVASREKDKADQQVLLQLVRDSVAATTTSADAMRALADKFDRLSLRTLPPVTSPSVVSLPLPLNPSSGGSS